MTGPTTRASLRRPIWLGVVLAAVAYLWWQSSQPDRYGRLPGSPESGRTLSVPEPQWERLRALLAGPPHPDTLEYVAEDGGARIRMLLALSEQGLSVHVRETEAGAPARTTSAVLEEGYFVRSLRQTDPDQTDFSWDVRESEVTLQRGGSGSRTVSFPDERGLLFEDLVLLQAPHWRAASATVGMLAFARQGFPCRLYLCELVALGDSLLLLEVTPRQSARLEFAPDRFWATRFCTARGRCFRLSPGDAS